MTWAARRFARFRRSPAAAAPSANLTLPGRATAADPGSVLSFGNVTHRYGELEAVRAVSFEVHRGEMFGLIGPDGAGKTTTLRMALGLLSPDDGEVRTLGVDPFRHRRRLSQRIGYLSQRFSIYGDLSIDENVAFFAKAHEMRDWKPQREQLLERLDLARFRTRLAERLSGGMKQKLALACTLIHTPELLVLDEPTTGVDPVSRREFWRILSELQREQLTLVITTPYLDEAERCHRVGLIDQGRLLVVDTPKSIRASLGGSMLEILAYPRREAHALLHTYSEVGDIEAFGERLHAALPSTPLSKATDRADVIAGALRAKGIEVQSIRPIEPSLEDVFITKLRARDAEPGGRLGAAAKHLLSFLIFVGAWAGAMPVLPSAASQVLTVGAPRSIGTMPQANRPPADELAAASSDSLRLTLEDAVARALANAPRLEQLHALQESAEGTTRESRASRFPQLNASAGYTRLSEEREFVLHAPTGEEISINPNLPDRWRTRLGLSWPLWSGGRTSASIDAAERAEAATEKDVEAGTNDLELETTQAYWHVVTERERLLVLAEAVRTYDAHAVDVQHRMDVGLAARNELLAIQVERDRADLARLEVANQARSAEENLQRLIGAIAPIRPLETLDPAAASSQRFGSTEGNLPGETRQRPGQAPEGSDQVAAKIVALQDAALAQRPEREALRARVEAAEARRRAERSGYLPNLSAVAGWDYARPSARIFPPEEAWEDSWEAGLQLNWTFFDAGRTAGATQRAEGQANALRAQLKDLEDRIRLEVSARARDLETARAAVEVANRAVESARENVLVSRDRFREGVLASSELLDAETSLLRADLDRTHAMARERIAAASLAHATGRRSSARADEASGQGIPTP